MHIFKYSRRAGTRADRMPDQIPEQVKTLRSDELLELEKNLSEQYRRSFLGKKTEILLEEETEIDGKAYMIGHTREYVKAVVPLEKGREKPDGRGSPDRNAYTGDSSAFLRHREFLHRKGDESEGRKNSPCRIGQSSIK